MSSLGFGIYGVSLNFLSGSTTTIVYIFIYVEQRKSLHNTTCVLMPFVLIKAML